MIAALQHKVELPADFLQLVGADIVEMMERDGSLRDMCADDDVSSESAPSIDKDVVFDAVDIDGNWLVNRLFATIEELKLEINDSAVLEAKINRLCAPATDRPHVFVAEEVGFSNKKAIVDYVKTQYSFERMLGQLTNVRVVESYSGPDANDVMVVHGRLPRGYLARVPYVKAQHVPRKYFNEGNVLVKKVSDSVGQQRCQMVCREMYPVWTHKRNFEMDAEELYNHYHGVTIKLCNKTGRILRWNPGVDIHSQPCNSLMGEFVLVGPKEHAFGDRS